MQLTVLLMIGSMDGGGSERQTLLLLKHLDRARFVPHLYVKRAEGSLLADVPDDVPIHVANDFAAQNRLHWPGRIQHQEALQLQRILMQQKVDVVYDRTYHMTLIAHPACEAIGVPRVSTIVSPPEHALPTVESRFIELKRRRLAKAYARSDQVIAVSHQAAESAVRYYGLDPNDLEVLHNPVDVEALALAASDRPNEYSEAESTDSGVRPPLHLVCVGRMTKEKGHESLLEAFAILSRDWAADLPKLRLHLVGDGPRRASLMDQAKTLGLMADGKKQTSDQNSVSFVGHQANAAPYVAFADALVLPSLFEGLPNVVLESMALSTPVIATRAGGTSELQRGAPIAFWAEPGDARSIANAIRQFVNHPERSREHCLEATQMIDHHHGCAASIDRIQAHLERVVRVRVHSG